MKKGILLLLLGTAFVACAKSPGNQETGYKGIPWGVDVQTVAKQLNAAPDVSKVDSLFGNDDRQLPRAKILLKQGFSKLVTGKTGSDPDSIDALKHLSRLDAGDSSYCLFFRGRFGMALQETPAKHYQTDHTRLMKRYGVIDKKVQYRANVRESAYLVQWHDADGIIILAREIYGDDPAHQHTDTQIIHMDKKLFDTVSSQLK
ncbi:MAG TPA: hypothetical protein VJ961_02840 [Mariprofundaceae bacterium]|nr:hypothetical protein [Mariprofundaceae bacterium]